MTVPPIEVGMATDLGRRRAVNQDNLVVQPCHTEEQWKSKGVLLMVADGMGGHKGGEKASELAVQLVPLTFSKNLQLGFDKALRRALLEANQEIHRRGKENAEFFNMGTTASVLLLNAEGGWIAHVGDSRIYRIRDGMVEQLSYDHSYVWEAARIHNVTIEEIAKHGILSNKITRCLGPEPEVLVDLEGPHKLLPGDTFLICSDGLSNKIGDGELGLICRHLPPQEACSFLVNLANKRGGPDNITVVIARIPGEAPTTSAPMERPTLEIQSPWKRLFPPLWAMALGAGLILGISTLLLGAISDYKDKNSLIGPFAFAIVFVMVGILLFFVKERFQRVRENRFLYQGTKPRVHRRGFWKAPGEIEKLVGELETLLLGLSRRDFPIDAEWTKQLESIKKDSEKNTDLTKILTRLAALYHQVLQKIDQSKTGQLLT